MTTRRLPLSVSARRDFTECPWKFKRTRLDRVRTAPVDLLEAGALAHEAIEAYVTRLVRDGESYAPDLVPEVWLEFTRTRPGGVDARLGPDARAVLERYARDARIDLARIWKPEASLAVDWDGAPVDWWAPDVFLRAKLDLVYVQGAFADIEDAKTGYVMETEATLQHDLQALTYPTMLRRHNPKLEHFTTTFRYVRWSVARTVRFDARETDGCWEEWRAFSDNVQAALADLDNRRRWAPRPGPHCATCPVAEQCPLGAEVGRFVIQDDETARTAAERLIALDAARAALVKQLKGYTEQHGPVDVNGRVAGWWPKHGREVQVHQAYRLAEEHDVDFGRFMKVDNAAVERLERDRPAFVKALVEHTTDKSTTEFRMKNMKEDKVATPEAA